MMEELLKNIERVEAHELRPNDVVVVKFPMALDRRQLEIIYKEFKETFPNNKCLILHNGVEFEIQRPVEER